MGHQLTRAYEAALTENSGKPEGNTREWKHTPTMISLENAMRRGSFAVLCGLLLVISAGRAEEPDGDGAAEPKVEKTYIHQGANFPFPGKVGEMPRVDVHSYDKEETNVSATYETGDKENPIRITVFVYPAPKLPKDADITKEKLFKAILEAEKESIVDRHDDAKEISDEPYTLKEAGAEHKGARVVYEFEFKIDGKRFPARSELLLFMEGEWLIKYRISYQKSTEKKARPMIYGFLKALVWTAI